MNGNTIVVLIEVGIGTFAQGFPAILRFLEAGRLIREERNCPSLPPAPHLPQLYQEWQQQYNRLGQSRKIQVHHHGRNSSEEFRKIQPIPDQVTHHESTIQTCQAATETLEKQLRQWFQQRSFQSLRDRILAQEEVSRNTPVPIVINAHTSDPQQDILLHKLPWHLWDLFDVLQYAEVVLNAGFNRPIAPLKRPIKILAIFGSSEGSLELHQDRAELGHLQRVGATIQTLEQPTRADLHYTLCNHAWDILFFAGHSFSEEQCEAGSIQIREGQSLSLKDLREDLRVTIQKGLKLAIFNSCDGLGIANYLAELQVPNMVVMREPVPDVIAREFLHYFLYEFASGKPLYLSVRVARRNLQWWESAENPCPAASWLPIVCQNPNQVELIWATQTFHSARFNLSGLTQLFRSIVVRFLLIRFDSIKNLMKKKYSLPIGFILLFAALAIVGNQFFRPKLQSSVQSPVQSPVQPSESQTTVNTFREFAAQNSVPRGTFYYGGSTAWAAIRAKVDLPLMQSVPGVQISYIQDPVESPSTGNGIAMLIDGKISFAQASRPLTQNELSQAIARGFRLKQLAVAYDAIVVVVHPDLNIAGLTIEQLVGIYTGDIQNWQEVGGSNLTIIPYNGELTGGAPAILKSYFPPGKDFKNNVLVQTPSEAIQRISKPKTNRERGGIYFASARTLIGQCTVKPLPIGVPPNAWVAPYAEPHVLPAECPERRNQLNTAAIQAGTYPLVRRLYVVVKDDDPDSIDELAGTAYANLLLTGEGQSSIQAAGFIPLLK